MYSPQCALIYLYWASLNSFPQNLRDCWEGAQMSLRVCVWSLPEGALKQREVHWEHSLWQHSVSQRGAKGYPEHQWRPPWRGFHYSMPLYTELKSRETFQEYIPTADLQQPVGSTQRKTDFCLSTLETRTLWLFLCNMRLGSVYPSNWYDIQMPSWKGKRKRKI